MNNQLGIVNKILIYWWIKLKILILINNSHLKSKKEKSNYFKITYYLLDAFFYYI